MLAIISRVYDRWTSFQFERQCRRLARRRLADPDDFFRCLMESDENDACSDALSWTSGLLARATPLLDVEPLSPPLLCEHLIEAHRRLPTRQRRLLLLYLARGQPFDALAARLRIPEAQALREICAAITRFRSELAAVEATRPQGN